MFLSLRKGKMSLFNLVAVLALVLTLLPATALAAPSGNTGVSKLSKSDRQLLEQARQKGQTTVQLIISTEKGETQAAADQVRSAGGEVRYQKNNINYLRAKVSLDKVDAVSKLDKIAALMISKNLSAKDPKPEVSPNPGPLAPGASTPNANPYMPTQDTGAAQFLAAHPTWDGRGVTIGIVDGGVDFDNPALQTTTTGERKIIDWVTGTDEKDDDDPTWLKMTDTVTVAGGTFTYKAQTYTAPPGVAGTLKIAIFSETDSRLYGDPTSQDFDGDLNRDGDVADDYAVLWNTATDTVYVDSNANRNFNETADATGMKNYKVNYDVHHFGVDNPGTVISEAIPFVVQTDLATGYVNIGISSNAHGSHVAGIAAGNHLFGGAMTGAAPGAKIKSSRACNFAQPGCTSHALIEGMIALLDSGIDVLNMSIGGLPALNDGVSDPSTTIYNDMIAYYGVQLIFSQGNDGPGVNTVGDPAVASNVIGVGSYITKETWYSNYGAVVPQDDNIHVYSGRGPREDGGFKPNIVAPGAAVSTFPQWTPGSAVAGTYTLPAGYGMYNGTSMAAPQATGAAALLLSAAKFNSVPVQPAQLRTAFYSTARYLANYQAYEQGNGLIQVGAAWDLLKKSPRPVNVTVKAPTNSVLGIYLPTPNVGSGIYDREGLKPGDSTTKTVTLRRTSGVALPGKTGIYKLSWVGNDGTFTAPTTVKLPLNTDVQITIGVNNVTLGAHSAILNIDDPSTPGIEAQFLNTVVASSQFTAANNYTVSSTGQAGITNKASFFFKVPANAPAFKVELTGVNGRVRVYRIDPWGIPIDPNAGFATNTDYSTTVNKPKAGVWEVTVDTSRTSAVTPATFTVKASVLGAQITPNPITLASVKLNTPTTVTPAPVLTSVFAPFVGKAVGSALGSARSIRGSVANAAQTSYTVTVPAGSTQLRAKIGNASDTGADIDLLVYRAGVLVGASTSSTAEEEVILSNPTAAVYTIVVDGYSVPAGTTQFDYLEVYTNPAIGTVAVTDADALRATGASWSPPVVVTAQQAPAAGRYLLGTISVVTGGLTVGSADVKILAVTP